MEGPSTGCRIGRCSAIRFLHGFVIELRTTYLKLSDEASEGLGVDSIWFRRPSRLLSGCCGLAFAACTYLLPPPCRPQAPWFLPLLLAFSLPLLLP